MGTRNLHNQSFKRTAKSRRRLTQSFKGIRTCFLLKKVSKNPKVQNITPPLIQAQHVVLVSGEV